MKLQNLSKRNLLFNTIRRRMPLLLLFAIVFVLAVPLICMLGFNQLSEWHDYNYANVFEYRKAVEEFVTNVGSAVGVCSVLLSAFAGVIAGCVSLRYLMNRQSAILFGSIPARREKQLGAEIGAAVFCYIAAVLIAALLTFVVYLFRGCLGYSAVLFRLLFSGSVWFAFFYALTLFMGMLSGLSIIQFALTSAAVIYLPVTVAILIGFYESAFYKNIELSAWLTFDLMRVLSPAVAMIGSLFNYVDGEMLLEIPWHTLFVYGCAALCLVALTVLLYRRRNTARSGQPIVFGAAAAITKYALMVPATLLFGWVFYLVNEESYAYMVIGFALGAVLSFMMLNVILHKNARAFFANIKGLGIFAAVFAVCFTVIAADPIDFDHYIPKPSDLKCVYLNVQGEDIAFTDPAVIDAINELVEYQEDPYKNDGSMSYWNGGTNVQVRYVLKNGISFVKYRYLHGDGVRAMEQQFKRIYASDELRTKLLSEIDDDYTISAYVYIKDEGYIWQYFQLEGKQAQQFKELLTKAIEGGVYSSDRGPIIANVSRYGGYSSDIPIYLDPAYAECLAYIRENCVTVGMLPSVDDVDEYLEGIASVRVLPSEWEEKYDDAMIPPEESFYNGSEWEYPVTTDVVRNEEEGQVYTDPDKIKEYYLASFGFGYGADYKFSYGSTLYFTVKKTGEQFYSYTYR